MFCNKCGQQLEDGARFCPNCGNKMGGTTFDDVTEGAKKAFNNAEQSVGSAINDVKNTFNNTGAPYGGERLQTDRSLIAYILLSIITCNIYSYYFIYKMAHDVNIACDGDGESTGGLVAFIILSFVTCGFYAYYWYYKLGNRLAANAPRYGMNFQENGTTVLCWCVFGLFICGIGPYVAMHILIKNTNSICAAYNKSRGLY